MRETQEITTPAGNVLVVNKYINGFESRALQVPYLKTVDELDKELVTTIGEKAARFQLSQNIAFRTVVVSMNGKTDGQDGFSIVDSILALPSAEFKFVVKAINGVVSDADYEEKKTEK